MVSAMREVLEGDDGKKLSIRSAAAKYNIPYPTLRKHILYMAPPTKHLDVLDQHFHKSMKHR